MNNIPPLPESNDNSDSSNSNNDNNSNTDNDNGKKDNYLYVNTILNSNIEPNVGIITNRSNISNRSNLSNRSNKHSIERKLSKIEILSNKSQNSYTGNEYESDDGNDPSFNNIIKNPNVIPEYSDDSDDTIDSRESINSLSRHYSIHKQIDLNDVMNKIPPPRKIGFNEVRDVVRSTFFSNEDYNSTAFDIIATYIKGQKILYMEAMSHCVNRLNLLMLPTILFSAIASVLSLTVDTYVWGPITVAAVNAFNGFLLSVVNYSKLDAASEAHKISSHQYDKLQSLCEFTSGKLMMTNNNNDDDRKEELLTIKKTMDEVESKIKDIKETNSFVIPATIRSRFMNIYYLNIFSVVKKIRDQEALLINKLKTKLNRVRNLEYLNKIGMVDNEIELTDNINELNDEITFINSQIISIKTKFTIIDRMFKQEIKRAEVLKRRGWFISSCCYSIDDIDEIEFIQSTQPNHFDLNKSKRTNTQALIDSFERNTKSMVQLQN